MKALSIRLKLTVLYVAVFGLFLAVFSGWVYLMMEQKLNHTVDQRLKTMAELIAKTDLCAVPSFLPPEFERRLHHIFGVRPTGKFVRLLDLSGTIGSRTGNLDDESIPVNREILKRVTQGEVIFETQNLFDAGIPVRFINFPVFDYKKKVRGVVQVGTSLEYVQDSMQNLLLILLISLPTLIFVAALAGYFLAGKALKPIRDISATTRHITANNLDERITVAVAKDEIGQLSVTINEMLDRLSQSFTKVKQFTADASHELRTPLTILRGEVEVGLRDNRTGDEYREILVSNLEEIERMSRIVKDLLFLSKADIGQEPLSHESLQLDDMISELLSQFTLLAEQKGIRLSGEIQPVPVMIGDSFRLRQMAANLLANAIRYTPAGGAVVVRLAAVPHGIELIVGDTGIGIPEADLPRIFDRFYRVDKARSRQEGGSGLGLSIVKWIVEAHHGEVLVDSVLDVGTTFTVRLPMVQHEGGKEIRKQ
ncbi:MAG: heavy metal sensor histidine kinase [Deltaproteobacteria bacterium]|nr:heavy metal sensor histidine kinase [Candidatus Anaeroferrophillus wilburensis]MBN2888494.1 heavy metal sensor histidine kinase [Deltaproteobacteria bacterium]